MKIDSDFKINTAELITVGTEILMGQILNTNSQTIARKLSDLGINAKHQQVVGDNPERLYEAIRLAMSRSELVILTGGLGPTKDDITMEIAAKASGNTLELDELAKEQLISSYGGRAFPENNFKQVYLPIAGKFLPNERGTAPGAIMHNLNQGEPECLLALLPGPPFENEYMFDNYLEDKIKKYSDYELDSIYIRTMGIGESNLVNIEEMDYYLTKYVNPSVAVYAHHSGVDIRLTLKHLKGENTDELAQLYENVTEIVSDYIYEIGQRSVQEVLLDLLVERGETIAFAESATASKVASKFADNPEASKALVGGVVTYTDIAKENLLDIPSEVINKYNAVSPEIAEAMAQGALKKFSSDYALSITGYAGQSAPSPDMIGLVYVGIADKNHSEVHKLNLRVSKTKIRDRASDYATNLMLKYITAK